MRASFVIAFVFGTVLSACGGGSSNPTTAPSTQPSGSTTFQGTLAGTAGQSGTLSITIQTAVARSSFSFLTILHAQSTTPVSGTLSLVGGGGTFNLTGTYDSSTRNVSLSGGGFTFTGTIGQGAVSGSYAGPNSSSGDFSGLDSTRNSITVYCGTHTSDPRPGEPLANLTGVFNLQVSSNGVASGVGTGTRCSGFVNGTTLTLTITGFDAQRQLTTMYTATGTVQGGNVNGTFVGTNNNDRGTFTGSTNACR